MTVTLPKVAVIARVDADQLTTARSLSSLLVGDGWQADVLADHRAALTGPIAPADRRTGGPTWRLVGGTARKTPVMRLRRPSESSSPMSNPSTSGLPSAPNIVQRNRSIP